MEKVYKRIPFDVKEIDRAEQTLWALGTTEAFDRDGDVIRMDGWELDNYLRNPVILWAHNYSQPPIGRALEVEPTSAGMFFKIQFANTEFAKEVFGLYADNFMRAWSVGFLPKDRGDLTDTEDPGQRVGYEYRRQELLELSAVPVPANPEALTLMRSKGVFEGMTPALVAELIGQSDWPPEEGEEVKHPDFAAWVITRAGLDGDEYRKAYDEYLAQLRSLPILPEEEIGKPYPNEHACRLKDPDQYDKCRRGSREHDGKTYYVIYCRKGDGPMEEQAYRYPKDTWTASEARSHCEGHDGSFEAATEEDIEPGEVPEMETDERSVDLQTSKDAGDAGEPKVEEIIPDDIWQKLLEVIRGIKEVLK